MMLIQQNLDILLTVMDEDSEEHNFIIANVQSICIRQERDYSKCGVAQGRTEADFQLADYCVLHALVSMLRERDLNGPRSCPLDIQQQYFRDKISCVNANC